MTVQVSNEYTKLLETKTEYLTKMLSMTVDFNNADNSSVESAESYISLIDKRQDLLDKINLIDNKLGELDKTLWKISGGIDSVSHTGDIKNRIKGIITEFLEADKTATLTASNIRAGLTKSIKDINNGRAATHLYDELKTLNTTRFDSSK